MFHSIFRLCILLHLHSYQQESWFNPQITEKNLSPFKIKFKKKSFPKDPTYNVSEHEMFHILTSY